MDRKAIVPTFTGILLGAAYLLMARELHFYDLPLIHQGKAENLLLNPVRFFPPELLSAYFFRLVLLAPAAIFLGSTAWANRLGGWFWERLRCPGLYYRCFLVSLGFILLSLVFVLQQTPLTDDETTYLLQADLLRQGRLYAPPPPVSEAFQSPFYLTTGKYTGKYQFFHPLLLALGKSLGSPYLLPVLLGAAQVLLVRHIAFHLFGSILIANLASVLLAISPLFFLTSATLLSHAPNGFLLSLCYLLTLSSWQQSSVRRSAAMSLVAGLCGGAAFNLRPLTALAFCLPVFLQGLWTQRHRPRQLFIGSGSLIAGFSVFLALTLWYNQVITGNFLTFPFHLVSPNERLGFVPFFGTAFRHSLTIGLSHAIVIGAKLNMMFLGIPLGLLFPAAYFFFGPVNTKVRWLFALIFCHFLAHIFYFFPGITDTGPVYYYEILMPLTILTAVGLARWQTIWQRFHSGCRSFPVAVLFVSLILSSLSTIPETGVFLHRLTAKITEPYRIIDSYGITSGVVFFYPQSRAGMVFGLPYLLPGPERQLVFCWLGTSERNLSIAAAFPTGPYYLLHQNHTGSWELVEVTRNALGSTSFIPHPNHTANPSPQ
jgi:hypothetical protein